jgi:uncharacterized protein YllA (UPF0747 family)
VIPDGCVDIFATAEGELMIAGPAKTMWSSLDSAFGVVGSALSERLVASTPHQRATLLAEAVADHFADTEPVIDRAVVQAVDVLRSRPDCGISTLAAGLV